MSNLIQLLQENQRLKNQLNKLKQTNNLTPYINDDIIKGGYHVVKTIVDRDNIDCCYRKKGMKVLVIGDDLSFKEYILKTDNCKENIWEEVDVKVEENEVFLIEDYSELSENLTTQKELNLVLKQLILNLQTQIDNIELADEKVQITEATDFAQIGQTQKDFNKNVSDYKTNSDLKNQEQDNRLTDIESENIEQYGLINDLQTSLNNKQDKLSYTPENIANKSDSYTISSSVTYASTKALVDGLFAKLNKGTYNGTAQDLKNSIDSKANISHTHNISDVSNLQTALDDKQNKLSSYDESILIETDGNIEGNVSLFQEYFQEQNCVLNFTPIQIIGVYVNGIKQRPSLYTITLPKTITIVNFTSGDYIEIQYTKLKI